MTVPTTERREFFRIKDRLFIEFREVDHEESLALEKSLRESNSMPEPLQQFDPGSPNAAFGRDDIYAYLEMLDRKLNMVIDLLSRKDQVFYGSYLDVVVSGSGLKFVSGVKLDEGIFVEIRLVLPFFPKPRIAALGKVVRCVEQPAEGGNGWETAISFVAINEKDRDVLVGYVFSKERESLRLGYES